MSKSITYDYGEITKRLSEKFASDQLSSYPLVVSKKNPSAIPAHYVDARAVQQRLDDTCVWKIEFSEDPRGNAGSIMAGLSILVATPYGGYEWITRWDGADNSDIEATKGGISGAMRRAGVQWGIGRYLYAAETDGDWWPLNEYKKWLVKPVLPPEFYPEGDPAAKKTKGALISAAQKGSASGSGSKSGASKPAAKPAVKVEPGSPEPEEGKKGGPLTADQLSALQAMTKGRDRVKVGAIYQKIISGDMTFDDGKAKIEALPTKPVK